jgi:transcriptional regulator NrdR family protein
MGRNATPQPRILANPTTLSTVPTGTNSNLAKFIFKPDTVSKHKNKLHRLRRYFGSAPQKSKVSWANIRTIYQKIQWKIRKKKHQESITLDHAKQKFTRQ